MQTDTDTVAAEEPAPAPEVEPAPETAPTPEMASAPDVAADLPLDAPTEPATEAASAEVEPTPETSSTPELAPAPEAAADLPLDAPTELATEAASVEVEPTPETSSTPEVEPATEAAADLPVAEPTEPATEAASANGNDPTDSVRSQPGLPPAIPPRPETTNEDVLRALSEHKGPCSVEALHRRMLKQGAGAARTEIGDFVDNLRAIADIWLVPTDHQLLAIPAGGAAVILEGPVKFRLRPDVFTAFTTVKEGATWYLPQEDRMVPGSLSRAPARGAVRVPQRTFDAELEMRRDFIDLLPGGGSRDLLEDALEEDRPYAAFSKALHRTDFVRRWHRFRFNCVFNQVWEWLNENGLEWPKGWLQVNKPKGGRTTGARRTGQGVRGPSTGSDGGPPGAARLPEGTASEATDGIVAGPAKAATGATGATGATASGSPTARPDELPEEGTPQERLAALIGQLNNEELGRISIPADLVLKILGTRR